MYRVGNGSRLERHPALLKAFRGVSAGAVLDEVAQTGLGELGAKDLVAAVPRKLGEASAVAVEEERLFALEICGPLAAPVGSLEAEIVAEATQVSTTSVSFRPPSPQKPANSLIAQS